MRFSDAKFPKDWIEAKVGEEDGAGLIEIELQGDYRVEGTYLTKEDARKLGEHLVKISSEGEDSEKA